MRLASALCLLPLAVEGFAPPSTSWSYSSSAKTSSRLFYNQAGDSPVDAWSALAQTERWISATLEQTSSAPSSGNNNNSNSNSNPYTRKEVSFSAETQPDVALVIASIWRRLHQARVQGEGHGQKQVALEQEQGQDYETRTMRQTTVIVMPNNGNSPTLTKFAHFDALFQQILLARRQARNYYTKNHHSVDNDDDEAEKKRWAVSVNCNHLHPQYGVKTPEEELEELKNGNDNEEVDLNYLEYQRKRTLAFQSPYPTFVVEVRSTPPADFGNSLASPNSVPSASTEKTSDDTVTPADIQRLEALFGKSAATTAKKDDNFYNAIGESIAVVDAVPPMQQVQTYMLENDEMLQQDENDSVVAAFTEHATVQDLDEAYDFVFSNIAMILSQPQNRQYLVLPQLLPHAATSFAKFALQVQAICDVVPELRGAVQVEETYHPEHVDLQRQSPVPVLLLTTTTKASANDVSSS